MHWIETFMDWTNEPWWPYFMTTIATFKGLWRFIKHYRMLIHKAMSGLGKENWNSFWLWLKIHCKGLRYLRWGIESSNQNKSDEDWHESDMKLTNTQNLLKDTNYSQGHCLESNKSSINKWNYKQTYNSQKLSSDN